MDPYAIIKHPLSTEKCIRLMESENRLVFIVDRRATKPEIRTAVEKILKVKIKKVNTFIDTTGKKRAHVTLDPAHLAMDVAAQLGLM